MANKYMKLLLCVTLLVTTSACGTLTGIPSHGGGKRFAVEQRLVSASARATLKDIDVSPLRGQKVAIVFDLVSDEGGGTITGGRASLGGILSGAAVMSPVTSSNSQFQVFDLRDISSSYSNTTSGTTGSRTANTTTIANISSNGTSTTNGSNTNTASTTQNGSGTFTETGTSSSTASGTSSGTSSTTGNSSTNSSSTGSGTSGSTGSNGTTTTTGAVSTTQTGTSTGSGNSSSTSSGSSTGTSSTSGTTSGSSSSTGSGSSSSSGSSSTSTSTNSTGSGSNTSTTNSSTSSTENGSAATGENTNSDTNADTNGNVTTDRQFVSNAPGSTQTQTKGERGNAQVELVYRGLGDYYNLAIPKSDASLLMGLTRNYLMLNGVQVTVPTDPEATAIVYVTVDVFGINRSRSDFYVYNEENVKAETAIEMFAFDRNGRLIMKPVNSNFEAEYKEKYIAWAGPFKTTKEVRRGEGMLEDFSDVPDTSSQK